MTSAAKGIISTSVLVLVVFACMGTWGAVRGQRSREIAEVLAMREQKKTVCVGRFLVDVPTQASMSMAHEMIGGFDVETIEETEEEFHAHVAAREAYIEQQDSHAGIDAKAGMVNARDLRVPGMVGRVFVYGHSRGYLMDGDRRIAMESVSVEVHAHVSGVSFTLSAKSTHDSSAAEAEALLARLQVRSTDEVPAVPGFCIARAIFTEPLPAHDNENVTLYLGLRGHPDLALVLFSVANAKDGPSLLVRTANVDAQASPYEALRVTKLRLGKRSINGMEGEEVVERVHEFNFTTGYSMNWETRGVRGDLSQPYLSFEMQTGVSKRPGGKPVDSSLHEDAVLALWDSISSTIRPNGQRQPK
jgi:hypothetical protein